MKDRGRETEEREKDKKRWNETEKWREGVNIHITLVLIRRGGRGMEGSGGGQGGLITSGKPSLVLFHQYNEALI